MPHFIGAILIAALGVQVLCALINVWWKISIHTAAIGGVTGGLLAFALIFNFNPLWWLCLVIFLGGVVGTSRMILRQHSLSQVTGGFLTGMLIAFFLILL
jgi:membrane-associated phospholipid phosphatase